MYGEMTAKESFPELNIKGIFELVLGLFRNSSVCVEVVRNLYSLLYFMCRYFCYFVLQEDKPLLKFILRQLIGHFHGHHPEMRSNASFIIYVLHKLNFLLVGDTERFTSSIISVVSSLDSINEEHDNDIRDGLSQIIRYIADGLTYNFF
jgi:hypothetical protein